MFYPQEQFNIRVDKLKFVRNIASTITFRGKQSIFWYSFFAISFFYGAGQIAFVYKQTQLDQIFQFVFGLCFLIDVTFKLFTLFIYRNEIDEMFQILDEHFWDLSVVGEIKKIKLENHLNSVVKLAKLQVTLAAGVCIYVMIFPATDFPDGSRNLPMLITLPFDHSASALYYFVFIFFSINGCLTIYSTYVFNYLFAYFSQHLIVQFKLLKEMLMNLASGIDMLDDIGKRNSTNFQRICHTRLTICVEHHIILLEFGTKLVGMFSGATGLQTCFCFLIGVTNLFLANWAYEEERYLKALKMLLILLCLYNEMAIFAYYGTELQQESSSLSEAAFFSDWYMFDGKLRYGLCVIGMMAQKELNLKGFKLIDIGYNTMISIIKITFSTVTLLNAMNADTM